MFLGIDPMYWMMMLPVLLLSMWASFKVKANFAKYSKEQISSGLTGAKAAEYILKVNGLSNVRVEMTNGFLSDHYDPTSKVVRLSPDVYNGNNIAAVGVAAHETGHALQHAQNYSPLILRNTVVPLAKIGSWMSYLCIFGGFLLSALGLVKVGIVLFSFVVFFQVITLPVEFNASSRAKELLASYNMVSPQELSGVKDVLGAAAMTYVAAAASAIVTLLYYVLRSGVLSSDD